MGSFIIAFVFIVEVIIVNFSEDQDVGILYLFYKFELDWSLTREIYNREKMEANTHTNTHTQICTETETDKKYMGLATLAL